MRNIPIIKYMKYTPKSDFRIGLPSSSKSTRNHLSDQLALPVKALAIREGSVSSWGLCASSSWSPLISSQTWAKCWMNGSVTACIRRALSSELTDALDDISFSGSNLLHGVCSSKLWVSVLLFVSSVSTATDFFIYQGKRAVLRSKVEFSKLGIFSVMRVKVFTKVGFSKNQNFIEEDVFWDVLRLSSVVIVGVRNSVFCVFNISR